MSKNTETEMLEDKDEVMESSQGIEKTDEVAKSDKKSKTKNIIDTSIEKNAKKMADAPFVKKLKAEKRVSVKIPIDKDNIKSNFVPVSINGYTYQIKRGVTVEVPEDVAILLEEAGYI